MGLKYFHFVFIGLAILCMLAFGLWILINPPEVITVWGRLGGAFSTLLAFVLVVYGGWFMRKSKSILP